MNEYCDTCFDLERNVGRLAPLDHLGSILVICARCWSREMIFREFTNKNNGTNLRILDFPLTNTTKSVILKKVKKNG